MTTILPLTEATTAEPLLTPREIGSTGLRTLPLAFDASVLGWVTGDDQANGVLDRFRDIGGTLISTADHHAAGRSEYMIGGWLRTVPRDGVIVATKVGKHPDAAGLGRLALERAVEASLSRLRTDYIDLLSFDGDLLPGDPLEAFETVDRMVQAGKVRFLGAARFSADRVRELQATAESAQFPAFQAVLAEYSLMRRRVVEGDLLGTSAELGVGFLALLPLAAGFLTGEVRSPDDVLPTRLFEGAVEHIGRRGTRVLAALERVAVEHNATLASVALAWVLTKPGVTAAVLPMRDLDTVDDGLLGTRIPLTRQQLAVLDDASDE